jgi:hypothetical protein
MSYDDNNVNIHYTLGGRDFSLHSVITASSHTPFPMDDDDDDE